MDRIIQIIEKSIEKVCKLVSFVSLIIMAVITFEVVSRYVFNNPTAWGWVINRQLFLVMTLFAGAYAFTQDAHIRIEMFYDRFSSRGKLITKIFTLILFVTFTGSLVWKGIVMAKQSISVHEKAIGLFPLPIYPFKTLIPIAAFLFMIQGLIRMLKKKSD